MHQISVFPSGALCADSTCPLPSVIAAGTMTETFGSRVADVFAALDAHDPHSKRPEWCVSETVLASSGDARASAESDEDDAGEHSERIEVRHGASTVLLHRNVSFCDKCVICPQQSTHLAGETRAHALAWHICCHSCLSLRPRPSKASHCNSLLVLRCERRGALAPRACLCAHRHRNTASLASAACVTPSSLLQVLRQVEQQEGGSSAAGERMPSVSACKAFEAEEEEDAYDRVAAGTLHGLDRDLRPALDTQVCELGKWRCILWAPRSRTACRCHADAVLLCR